MRNISPILIGLIALIAISSCTIRNPIQAFLDIPISKNSSPSKTTLSDSDAHCVSIDNEIIPLLTEVQEGETLAGGNATVNTIAQLLQARTIIDSVVNNEHSATSLVPLYILYRKLKVSLS